MGKPSRRSSRRTRDDRHPEPRKRIGIWLWSGLALAAVVIGLGIEAGLDRDADKEIVSRAPAADGEVLAYVAKTATWEPAVVKDLSHGREFQHDGRFYRVDKHGESRMNPHIPLSTLAATDRLPEGDRERFPQASDVVRFLNGSAHVRFDRMGTLRAGSRLLFQGILYEGVADPTSPTGISIKKTDLRLSKVTQTFKRKTDALVDLVITDESGHSSTITGTAEHPFFVPEIDAYVPMGELLPGMVLETGDQGVVTVVEATRRAASADVYNIEVEGAHNYFVAADEQMPPVLVHNVCELDLVRLKRPRQLADDVANDRIFKLAPDELKFVERVMERKPNLQIYRTNQKAKLGDFLVIDRSNPKDVLGIAVELKQGGGGAGNQLQNIEGVLDVEELRVKRIFGETGTADELIEMLSRGRSAYLQKKAKGGS